MTSMVNVLVLIATIIFAAWHVHAKNYGWATYFALFAIVIAIMGAPT